ncbi:MAG: hypothetical protein CMP05_08010 [Xanthomarina sp.]|jgi:uncharacterized membrane protein|uniref:Uncharacterized protein n=1 Tax=Xanthomarina gelatinilytica TaxID=1137281 RepID=A0A3D6BX02_9FLAO|nr:MULTISPECIES: hypothetical protein [Xanthomarina]MCB0388630.1 hypothetical protein [Winogradskyella sp.]MAL23856.1 hypothetical protein [Xanthomarina sp.]MBF61931.1 hypothetical protein [Xanthomarina sp.]MDX1318023.1 hypothetical protein [Xanthomarina gelatinilytica]HAB28287.1 hypothetical protein [Xanthomarina gelatinilytica]|tara:strand:- start:613 stop:816 length:204 start_codon:yes stop_codon:yes gene_type:complete
MKIFKMLLSLIAIGLIIYNFTKVDFNAPFEDDSVVAFITIFASMCALILLQILRISQKIDKQYKTRK